MPIENKYGDFRYNDEVRKTVAAERNNIDFLYFTENESPSFELFKTYGAWNEAYPEWYRNNEISRQMKNIVRLYTVNKPKEMEYHFLTPQIMDAFVNEVSIELLDDLKNKELL